MQKFDRSDAKILQQIQQDASLTNAELAEAIGLSTNACWRRTRRLMESGIIRRQVALLDQEQLGLGVTVFVSVRTSQHNQKWLDQFAQGVANMPEVIEFYRLSGELDYLLKIVVADIADYDRVYKKLMAIAPLTDVTSSFAMERIKSTTALPIPA